MNANPKQGMAQQLATMSSNILTEFNKHPLATFLAPRRVDSGSPDVTMSGTTGSQLMGPWSVNDNDYDEFLDLLHDYLFTQGRTPMGFVERDRITKRDKKELGEKPLLIDLDFEYPISANLSRKFQESHIRAFVFQLIQGLKTFFDISNLETLRMFVCLRPIPYRKTGANQVIKDGIHIECPDICLSNEKQKVLRAYLLEQHAIAESFEGTDYNPELKEEKIYDSAMTRSQGWYFYGESKPSIPPYSLAYIFAYNPDTDDITKEDVSTHTSRELMELLSIRYNLLQDQNEVLNESKDLYNRLLNGRSITSPQLTGGQGGTLPDLTLLDGQQENTQIILRSLLNASKDVSPEDYDLIERLVMECLSQQRAEDYTLWKEVGWCLYHISSTPEMSEKMFDLYMRFSAKSAKSAGNNESQLRREWERNHRSSSERSLKWGSLHYWARNDNPQKYKEIMDEDLINYIATHVNNTHYHIATVAQRLFSNFYKANIDKKSIDWYMYLFEQHIWKHVNQGVSLRGKLSNEVVEIVMKARRKVPEKYPAPQGEVFSEIAQKRLKELLAVERSLYSAGTKDSIMKECAGLLNEDEFAQRLNVNPYLFVCKNGVLNLRAVRKGADGKDQFYVDFRPGRPEDMMTFLAGKNPADNMEAITYRPYDPNGPYQKDLQDFFTLIFPAADVRRYVLILLCSCLEGYNREQCYWIWYGGGGNGKSKILDLMRHVFGEYQKSLSTAALTRKRPDSGAANPDIISIKNKRFIYMGEPDEREPLNTSRMKQLSGEDMVEARGLFSDQENFKVCGKLHMLTNALPPINTMDRGTWRRLKVIPFISKFVGPGDKDYADLLAGRPNVFPKDLFLDDKLKLWREAFLSLLVHLYETVYCREGLVEPDAVRMASYEYKEEFDNFAKFRNARIRISPGEQVEFNDASKAYRHWSEWVGGGSGKRLDTKTLRKRMEDEFGNAEEGKYFRNIIVFMSDEDVEEWDREHATQPSA